MEAPRFLVLQKKINLIFYRCTVFIFLITVSFFSCVNHETVVFESHSINTSDEITSVYFHNASYGIAVGGTTWTRGIVCSTLDGGNSWKIDSVFDKKIFCLSHNSNGLILAMGIELNLYELRQQETIIHRIKHPGSFKFIRGVSLFDSNTIMAVHGLGSNGSIEKISLHADSTRTVLNINRELNAIKSLDSSKWIACGFGIVLRTEDAGEHWDTLNVFGDHYVDIAWQAPSSVYILGLGGTVLRSDDQGNNFYKVKSGGTITNSPTFNCIGFKNAYEGIIAGEKGLVMLTRNGGVSWSVVDGLPTFDVMDIFIDVNRYWLCGDSGTIISFVP